MRGLKTDKIKGIIWDLDDTLYRFDEVFVTACNHAAANAAIKLGVELSFEEAAVMAEESFYQFGFSGAIFEQRYSISREEYHYHFHDSIDEKIIEVNQAMIEGMRKLTYSNVILTNASRGWADKVLNHLALNEFFDDNKIIAQEDAGFISKAGGQDGFILALTRMDLKPEDVLMVDDMAKNLRIPKEMGMQTALIHHHKAGLEKEEPDWVDASFADTLHFIDALV